MLARLLSTLIRRDANRAAAPSALALAARAREAGNFGGAIEHYRMAIGAGEGGAAAINDLGVACCEAGDLPAARAAFERALQADPSLVTAAANLAQVLQDGFGEHRRAVELFGRVLAADPGQMQSRKRVAMSLYELGRAREAVDGLRAALGMAPQDAEAHQALLFMSHALAGRDPRLWFEEHRSWARMHADALPRAALPPRRAITPETVLKVGLLSADLREHATARFLLPLLESVDRSRMTLHCFSNTAQPDAMGARMRAAADGWHELRGLDDDSAAALIAGERMDVLLDLGGHTLDARPGVVARRPAPLVAGWLGYLDTSGMRAVDLRLTDARIDPPGTSDSLHVERLARLDGSMWCFAPGDDPLPARLVEPAVTFGSLNHTAKLNDGLLDAWAALLLAAPASRLVVAAVPDAQRGEEIAGRLMRHGVARDRLELVPRQPRAEFARLLGRIDLALDSFPYSGGATTMETLWCGVPVLSLAGDFGFARSGASLLEAAGLGAWVTHSEAEYVARGAALAADPQALRALAAGLRDRLARSVLLDQAGFAARVEARLRAELVASLVASGSR
jgi:protein O-GlcNAc transferase